MSGKRSGHNSGQSAKKRKIIPGLMVAMICSSSLLFLSGCETDEQTKTADAQSCIDTATQSTVATCVAMVAGITSTEAYAIRCSAHYIANGFTSDRFASAFQKIASNTGTNPFSAALGFLVFPAKTGTDGSTQTLSDCNQSQVPALQRIALLTSMVTDIYKSTTASITPAADGSISQTDITNAITGFNGTASDLGTLAVQANSAFCSAGSAFATNTVCTKIAASIGSSTDLSAIGTALLNQLK